jgi:hypothetical protein
MPDTKTFLSDIASADPQVRFAAWRSAGEVSPDAIPELGKLAGSKDPGIAKAAREALTTMTHAVGKDPKAPQRAAVVAGLLALTRDPYPIPARIHAYRLLSNIAGEDAVPEIAKGLKIAQLNEEAIFCLERIPGTQATKAIAAAYKDAEASFQPRILAALGHRQAPEGLEICMEAARSPNKELAIAALKAWARIGRNTPALPAVAEANLTVWEKVEHVDSILRYADAQARAGNQSEALRLYKLALARPEEHWQCAAIIGIARLGTAEAATEIFPKLKSPDPKVRITARKAWESMARS